MNDNKKEQWFAKCSENAKQVADNTSIDLNSIESSFRQLADWSEQLCFFVELFDKPYSPEHILTISKAFEFLKDEIHCDPDLKQIIIYKRDKMLFEGYNAFL